MKDDSLARAMFVSGWNGETEAARAEMWDGDSVLVARIRERWRHEAERVRVILGFASQPEHGQALPDDVVQCPLCGQQRLNGHSVECGDDDSVSVDDVFGILAPGRSEEHDYGKSFARNHVYWSYDLTEAARMTRDLGYEWRWFGFRVPWTQVAVGFFYKRLRR